MNDPLEREFAAWLREGSETGLEAARERALAATRTVAQRPAWLVAATGGAFGARQATTVDRRHLVVLAAIGLLLACLVGLAVGAGMARDPLRSDVPPVVVAEASPAPSVIRPSPSVGPITTPPGPGVPYGSAQHGYTIMVPPGWTVTGASRTWSGSGPWDALPEADVFEAPAADSSDKLVAIPTHFSVTSVTATDVVLDEVWLRTHLPSRRGRHSYCSFSYRGGTLKIPAGDGAWTATDLAGRPAQWRWECGYVEAAIAVGGRIVVLSLFTAPGEADTSLFRTFADTMTFKEPGDDPGARTVTTVGFASDLYGYGLRLPADWIIEPATSRWSGADAKETGPVADTFGAGLLTVKAVEVPPGASLEGWIQEHPLSRSQGRPGYFECLTAGGGSLMIPSALAMTYWMDGEIGGYPARIKADCDWLDGFVIVDDRLYVMSLAGDLDTYDRIARAITFGAQSPPPPVETTFDSPTYGYRLRIPDTFVAYPAAFAWEPGDGYGFGRGFDRFEGWAGDRIRIASTAIPAAVDMDEWLADILTGGCVPTGTPWSQATIGGVSAQIRDSVFPLGSPPFCTEAYAIVASRLYAFQASEVTEDELVAFLQELEYLPAAATSR